MFPHFATLTSRFSTSHLKQAALDSWDNTYFGLPYLSQESMVLSQLLLLSWTFSYSFTKSKIYSICESLTNSFEVPKSGKTATKYINKSLKKSIIDIFIMYIISWVRFAAPVPAGNSRFKILIIKISSLTQ